VSGWFVDGWHLVCGVVFREALFEVMVMICRVWRVVGLLTVVVFVSERWDGPLALAIGAVLKAVVGLVVS